MITNDNYATSANIIGCEVRAIKTVAAIESYGSGFNPDGTIKILFEPHVFWKELIKKGKSPEAILKANPGLTTVLYKKWKTYPYGKNSEQWDRLRMAAQIDMEAAHLSASYGKFQIMGNNHKAAGYDSVFQMTHFYEKGEEYHLESFSKFIINSGLADELKRKDWTNFARMYNGAGYRNYTAAIEDDYDYKLKVMYSRIAA